MSDRLIYRYEIPAEGNTLYIKDGLVLKALCVEADLIEVWVLHTVETATGSDPQPKMGLRSFGTGKVIPEGWQYLTTCDPFYLGNGNRAVWHVFKEPEPYDPEMDEGEF